MKVTLKSELTKEKERLMSRLSELDPIEDKQEYDILLNDIGRCMSLTYGNRKSIDPNTILSILGTFGSILLIMNYERDNILNAKAFSFVKKP